MAGRIAHQQEQAIVVERDKVVEVAARLIGRCESPAEIVTMNYGHVLRQGAHLHVACDRDLPVESFRCNYLLRDLRAVQDDGSLRRKSLCDELVFFVKHAFILVKYLQDADQ